MITRREFLAAAAVAAGMAPRIHSAAVTVPVHLVFDSGVPWKPWQIQEFRRGLWAQAAGELERCGIHLEVNQGSGEVERPPGREPVLSGLERGMVNFVVTGQIPMEWDSGRSLSGVTTNYRGYHLCMVALRHAHGNQVPLLSLNTCLHELLHALLQDVYAERPAGWLGQERELRVDWYGTRLWLFGDGAQIRQSALAYVTRLRAEEVPRNRQ